MHRLASFSRSVAEPPARLIRALLRPFAPFAGPLGRTARLSRGAIVSLGGLIPAFLAGAGVFLVVAGLFNYFQPMVPVAASPTSDSPTATPAALSLSPLQTPGPTGTPGPSEAPNWPAATRIVIPALGIDTTVIPQPANEIYPLCDTAEYLVLDESYGFPGAPRATYLFAHARVGMFWQLLVNSKVKNGAGMIGMWVQVYTDDNQDHIYEITQVIRHVPPTAAFADVALTATTDQLWLQTSEGHLDSSTKLQVVAMPIGVIAATQAEAHPKRTAKVCPDKDLPVCTNSNQSGCRKP